MAQHTQQLGRVANATTTNAIAISSPVIVSMTRTNDEDVGDWQEDESIFIRLSASIYTKRLTLVN